MEAVDGRVRPFERVQRPRPRVQVLRLAFLLPSKLLAYAVVFVVRPLLVSPHRHRVLVLLLRLDSLARLPLVVKLQSDEVPRHWRVLLAHRGPVVLVCHGLTEQPLWPAVRAVVHLWPKVVPTPHVYTPLAPPAAVAPPLGLHLPLLPPKPLARVVFIALRPALLAAQWPRVSRPHAPQLFDHLTYTRREVKRLLALRPVVAVRRFSPLLVPDVAPRRPPPRQAYHWLLVLPCLPTFKGYLHLALPQQPTMIRVVPRPLPLLLARLCGVYTPEARLHRGPYLLVVRRVGAPLLPLFFPFLQLRLQL